MQTWPHRTLLNQVKVFRNGKELREQPVDVSIGLARKALRKLVTKIRQVLWSDLSQLLRSKLGEDMRPKHGVIAVYP